MQLKELARAGIIAAAVGGVVGLTSHTAQAGLVGNGTNTVDALFYLGSIANGEEIEDYGSPPVAGPALIGASGVDFVEGAQSGSTVHVGDTSITITNLFPASMPFCSVSSTPCPDSFTGFSFQFSSGVDITGVTVDPASAAAFLPILGGLTFTPTDILVNLAGDAPDIGNQLILDLSFASNTPPPVGVPEPAAVLVLTAGLLGLAAARRRHAG